MRRIIGVDPGVHRHAWAVGEVDGDDITVVSVGYEPKQRFVEALSEMLEYDTDIHLVVEKPTIYSRSGVRASDIVDLAIGAGEVSGVSMVYEGQVTLVEPRTWKGSVPKAVTQARVTERIGECKALVEAKKTYKSKVHNVFDAIGLMYYGFDKLR